MASLEGRWLDRTVYDPLFEFHVAQTQGWQSAPTAWLALHVEFAGQVLESPVAPAKLQAARQVPASPGFCVTNPVAEPPSAPINSTGSKASQTKPAGHAAVVESVIQNWVQ
jgi:hypothetical protein